MFNFLFYAVHITLPFTIYSSDKICSMITDVLNFPLDFTSIDDYRLKMEIENVPI